MIIFFYGEDDFRLKQAIKKLKEKFISASLGDTNLAVLEGKTVAFNELVRQILAMPFLSRTRLVIIENLISDGKKDIHEKVIEFLPKVPSTTVLVFTETKPDKRTALFKKLVKADKLQEFKLLEEEQLRRWIRKELEVRSTKYEEGTITKLIEYVGNDLWRMTNEIQKLTTYNRELSTKNIELLVKSQVESDIFKMVDAVGQKNLKVALKECQNLLLTGANELYILSMIVYQYRNLLIIKDLQERSRGNVNSWALAKKACLHPYVVQKTLVQAKNFSLSDLKKSYRTLLDFDWRLKTGKIEGKAALSLLLAKFCV
jgi:DNA polymerase-3 subunit delta